MKGLKAQGLRRAKANGEKELLPKPMTWLIIENKYMQKQVITKDKPGQFYFDTLTEHLNDIKVWVANMLLFAGS